jgi:hypothetical protein
VARPRLGEVVELEQPLHGAKEATRALLRLDREVRPREIRDEEGISREDEPGIVAAARIGDQIGGVLRTVARRRERADLHVADRDRVAVRDGLVLELDVRVLGDVDRGPRRASEPALARDMVGVVVRLENVADPEVVLVREAEVLVHVPLRIDDRRLAPVCDHVGGAAEVLMQHLPEEHRAAMIGP